MKATGIRTQKLRYGIVAMLAISLVGTVACGGAGPQPPTGPTIIEPTPTPPTPTPTNPGSPSSPNIPEQPSQPQTPPAQQQAQIAGTYLLQNQLDIGPALPEQVLQVVETVHAIADDPAGFLLDQIIERTDGALRSALELGRGVAAPLINEWIEDNAPQIVNDIRDVAIAVGEAVHKLEFGSRLEIPAQGGDMLLSHYITSFSFNFRGERVTLGIDQLGEDSVASAVDFPGSVNGTSLTIGEHNLSFNYGQVILGAVNTLLVPRLAPGATNIGELLVQRIDCQAVAERINDAVSLVPVDAARGACDLGLQAGAGFISSRIESLTFDSDAVRLAGQAEIADRDGDLTYDRILNGRWTANISIGGSAATLASEADIFTGERN